jgi:hypothetical protein
MPGRHKKDRRTHVTTFLDKVLAEYERLAPKSGANLVGQDAFEPVEESLYLIEHYPTEEAAIIARDKMLADPTHNGDKLFVYLPKGVKSKEAAADEIEGAAREAGEAKLTEVVKKKS